MGGVVGGQQKNSKTRQHSAHAWWLRNSNSYVCTVLHTNIQTRSPRPARKRTHPQIEALPQPSEVVATLQHRDRSVQMKHCLFQGSPSQRHPPCPYLRPRPPPPVIPGFVNRAPVLTRTARSCGGRTWIIFQGNFRHLALCHRQPGFSLGLHGGVGQELSKAGLEKDARPSARAHSEVHLSRRAEVGDIYPGSGYKLWRVPLAHVEDH